MVAVCLCAVMLVGQLVGCSSIDSKQSLKVVGESAGYDIRYGELRFVTLVVKDAMEGEYGSDIWTDPDKTEQYRAELEERVLDKLRANYLILAACDAYGIDTSADAAAEYADEQIDSLIESECGGKKSRYRDYLEENWLTDDFLRLSLRVSRLESGLYYTLLDNGYFTYSGYDSTTGENDTPEFINYVMTSPDYAHTVHIYLRNDEGEDPAENLTDAEQIVRALRATAGYEQRLTIMNGYIGSAKNDDIGNDVGSGYYFTHGEMDEAYEQAAFSLAVGDVSDPFVFEDGYMVIMRLEPELDYVTNNVKTLMTNFQSAEMGQLEESYAEACRVLLNDYGLGLDLAAME